AVLGTRGFDTYEDSSAGNRLRDYLNGLHGHKIVLVAIQDEGSIHMSPAIDALKRLGATDPVQPDDRGSFAFAGYAEANKPQWITQRRIRKEIVQENSFFTYDEFTENSQGNEL
ncbi:hypothetical protein pdam_00006985, partial [Pocillopora damicornis]